MNKNNAAQYLPLVQALADGRVIRARNSGYPVEMGEVNFSLPPECYDIKPEPREWWLLINSKGGILTVCNTNPDPAGCARDGYEVVHVREVTQ